MYTDKDGRQRNSTMDPTDKGNNASGGTPHGTPSGGETTPLSSKEINNSHRVNLQNFFDPAVISASAGRTANAINGNIGDSHAHNLAIEQRFRELQIANENLRKQVEDLTLLIRSVIAESVNLTGLRDNATNVNSHTYNSTADSAEMRSGRTVRFTNFVRTEATGWFNVFETILAAKGITSDIEKFEILTSHLPSDIVRAIPGLYQELPADAMYETLKNELLEHHAVTERKKLETLFKSVPMGNRRPSAFLQEMTAQAGSRIPTNVIIELWRAGLPKYIRCAIVDDSNDRAPAHADRVFDILKEDGLDADARPKQDSSEIVKALESLKHEIRRSNTTVMKTSTFEKPADSRAPQKSNTRAHINTKTFPKSEKMAAKNSDPPKKEEKNVNKREPELINGQCKSHYDYGNAARYCHQRCERCAEFESKKNEKRSENC